MEAKEVVVEAIKVGIEEIIRLRRRGEVERVGDPVDPSVSIGDLKTGEAMFEYLQEALGNDAKILVEETAKKLNLQPSSADCIVDPIDCTRSFTFGLPGFGTMVGLLEKGELVAGGIGQVGCNGLTTEFWSDIYLGWKVGDGFQATLNGQPIAATKETDPREANVYVEIAAFDATPGNFQDGFKISSELIFPPQEGRSRWYFHLGSSSFAFSNLARGALSVMTGSRKPWDILPALPVVLGAGADYFIYKDGLGLPRICVAANPALLDYATQAHERAGMSILDSKDYLIFEMEESVF